MKKTKAAAKKTQKAEGAEAIEPDGALPPKKARGRKKAVKVDDDGNRSESIAKEEGSDEPIPAPRKKSQASRKAAIAKIPQIPDIEENGEMEETTEGAQKPKKGRKNTVKGAKDEVSASASFLPDFRLTVRPVLR